MPGFFLPTETGDWTIAELDGAVFRLGGDPIGPRPLAAGPRARPRVEPELRRCWLSAKESWFLLVPGEGVIWVNGRQVLTQARLLRDRDSIRCEGTDTIYFSTETLARATEFDGRDEVVICPRCKLEVEIRQLAIRCPGCGVFHHQDPGVELECWAYSNTCAGGCGQSTDPDAGYSWTPADVGA